MEEFKPKAFGKHYLIEKLATGGMAEIYKAKTFGVDGFEKLLAIKRILPHCSADKEFIHMLIDEAKLSVLLSHTNIVQVYDLGKVRDDYFISMEYIEGCNLRELLSRLKDLDEQLDEQLVIYIISEICKGLDYAHSKKDPDGKPLNIVHRDISPQNILISFEGEVKIVDFGIAKAAMNMSNTMAGILKGKISYMSPEQALGKPIDRKTDIFSAGLILYELLTGKKLFTGETQFEVLKKIRSTRLNEDSFSAIPSEPIRKILAKALAYSTKERYDNAGDFQIELTRYLYTTYADFTPRKLAKEMRQLFADEIKQKKVTEKEALPLDAQTRSILIDSSQQEDIVHRENTAEVRQFTSEKQSTQTFFDSFIKGKETDLHKMTSDPTRVNQNLMESIEPSFKTNTTQIKNKKNRLILALYPLLALLVIGLGYLVYDQLIKPPTPQVRGALQLNSSPPGAQIFINEGDTGYITPATIPNLPVGKKLTITLKKEKRKTWTRSITLSDSEPLSFSPTLEPVPLGAIKIVTTPPKAKIYINGKDSGKLSPATLDDLPISETHTVRIELEKHKPVEEKVTIFNIDEPRKFDIKLEEILYGQLKVSSKPSNASIFINNKPTGKRTPATLSDLEYGRYTISLSKADYNTVTRSVEISKESSSISERLNKKTVATTTPPSTPTPPATTPSTTPSTTTPPTKPTTPPTPSTPSTSSSGDKYAYLTIQTDVSGASLYINRQGKGSAGGKHKVSSGKSLHVMVTKQGYASKSRVVTLRPGESRTLNFKLEEGTQPISLTVQSNPAGANVILNGRKVGKTPVKINNLKPGRVYNVRVNKSDYADWSQSITAGSKNQTVSATLKKI